MALKDHQTSSTPREILLLIKRELELTQIIFGTFNGESRDTEKRERQRERDVKIQLSEIVKVRNLDEERSLIIENNMKNLSSEETEQEPEDE
jgi:hypothetical protein